jgi:phosphoribosylanthranilate isomerase
VGVFAGAGDGEIRRTIERCALDLAQLHGQRVTSGTTDLGVPLILGVQVRDALKSLEMPSDDTRQIYAYLLDTYAPDRLGGTGQTWDWSVLSATGNQPTRIIVAGGLTPENVREAMRLTHPFAVDVSSGVEQSPGRKDPHKVFRFIQNVREEDAKHERL